MYNVLKQTCVTTIIAFALCVPLVFYSAGQNGSTFYITPRWHLVLGLCSFVFLCTLCVKVFLKTAQGFYINRIPHYTTKLNKSSNKSVSTWYTFLQYSAVGIAILLPLLLQMVEHQMTDVRYWLEIGTSTLIYVMLAWGLSIMVGMAGILSFGYIAFYAIGAYSSLLISNYLECSFWVALPIAVLITGFAGYIFALPVLNLRGDYAAIVTLALGEITRLFLLNLSDLTGGASGVSFERQIDTLTPTLNLSQITQHLFSLPSVSDGRTYLTYYSVVFFLLLVGTLIHILKKKPMGRKMEALSEDEIALKALGINPTTVKIAAFIFSSAVAGLAGSFFSVRQGFISPDSFTFNESVIVLSIVVLGGMKNLTGIALAGGFITLLPELLRNVKLFKTLFGPSFDFNEYRILVFGLCLVLIMIFRPKGILPLRIPSIFLKNTNPTL